MADIRINALATTAASTASDDFVAVDGSANGTRKLNAFSPTFGGNLTVSGGTGTIDATSGTASATLNLVGRSSGTAKTASVLANSAGSLVLGAEGAGSSLTIAANTGNTTVAYNLTVSGTAINLSTNNSTDKVVSIGYSTVPLYLTSSYDGSTFGLSGFSANSRPSGSSYTTPSNTSYGNLYFLAKIAASDTASAFEWKHAPRTAGTPVTTSLMTLNGSGNLLIGTTTDSGNGKLQLATHTTSAGGIGFGTDTSLYRYGAGFLAIDHAGAANSGLFLYENGVIKSEVTSYGGVTYVGSKAGNTIIQSNNTTALTLDSSQNATFAGDVGLSGNEKYLNLFSTYSVGSNSRARLRAVGSGGGSGYGGSFTVDTRTSGNTFITALTIDDAQNATFAGWASIRGTGSGSAQWIGDDGADGWFLNVPTSNVITLGINNTARVVIKANTVQIVNLPTSSSGLNPGDLWNDSGTVKIA